MSALGDGASEGDGWQRRVVVLVGEPGLGKTRLVRECRKLFGLGRSGIRTAAALARGPGCVLCVRSLTVSTTSYSAPG